MRLLGIDPGEKTGWCIYSTNVDAVLASGTFPQDRIEDGGFPHGRAWDLVVIERPKGYGPTYPQVVDAAFYAGSLGGHLQSTESVRYLTRLEVCKALTAAVHGVVNVRNDATAWAALKLIHGGDGSDKKPRKRKGEVIEPGGPIGGVKSHERAALAVAIAWILLDVPNTAK